MAFVTFGNYIIREAIGKADWVYWPDADEIMVGKDVRGRLDFHLAAGDWIVRSPEWQMISDKFPTTTGQIYEKSTRAFTSSRESIT